MVLSIIQIPKEGEVEYFNEIRPSMAVFMYLSKLTEDRYLSTWQDYDETEARLVYEKVHSFISNNPNN